MKSRLVCMQVEFSVLLGVASLVASWEAWCCASPPSQHGITGPTGLRFSYTSFMHVKQICKNEIWNSVGFISTNNIARDWSGYTQDRRSASCPEARASE